MPASPWQRRIRRAEELAGQHAFAAEILRFYIHVVRFHEDLYRKISVVLQSPSASADRELSSTELAELSSGFQSFLSMAEAHGPKSLAELSRQLCALRREGWSDLLQRSWMAHSSSDAEGLLAQAFLQPYVELLRSRASLRPSQTAYALCPFCSRKPALGVLRQMGDGGARSMVCSFCLAEWDFRRIVCPGCGEEDDKKLAVFMATDFDYIRVECCDSCKTYIKTIDLTKNGRAEPLVDELASAPLDLWAREHGYAKLQHNLFGM
jgi:formate dehydrogenase accessory protein FdhE